MKFLVFLKKNKYKPPKPFQQCKDIQRYKFFYYLRSYSLKKLTNSDGSFIISYILPPQLSQKTKQMVINNLTAISHVFKTSNTPILHVFEVLAKKLGQKKSSIERAAMAHARCLSLL